MKMWQDTVMNLDGDVRMVEKKEELTEKLNYIITALFYWFLGIVSGFFIGLIVEKIFGW